MSGSKFKRCLWLVNTIRSFGPISFEDISRRWEFSPLNDYKSPLSKKSFHNYCNGILDFFNIRIICERRGGYKYRLEKNDTSDWTMSLVEALCMANDTEMSKRVVDCNVRYPLVADPQSLGIIFEAARNNLPISFSWYVKRKIENFYPAFFIKVGQRWYIIGFFTGYSQLQIVPFKLDAMSEVKVCEGAEKVEPPRNFDINEYLAYISETKSNETYGRYYTEESLRDICTSSEEQLKEHVTDAYFRHLANLEFFSRVPKGATLYTAGAYYQTEIDPKWVEGIKVLSDEDVE